MPMKSPRSTVTAYSDTLSLGGVAKMLHLPRREVRRLVGKTKLPFMEVRGQIRVPRNAVEQLRLHAPHTSPRDR